MKFITIFLHIQSISKISAIGTRCSFDSGKPPQKHMLGLTLIHPKFMIYHNGSYLIFLPMNKWPLRRVVIPATSWWVPIVTNANIRERLLSLFLIIRTLRTSTYWLNKLYRSNSSQKYDKFPTKISCILFPPVSYRDVCRLLSDKAVRCVPEWKFILERLKQLEISRS